MNVEKMDDIKNCLVYCIMTRKLFPELIKTPTDDLQQNLNSLKSVFATVGVKKEFPTEALKSGSEKDALDFLIWFKSFFEIHQHKVISRLRKQSEIQETTLRIVSASASVQKILLRVDNVIHVELIKNKDVVDGVKRSHTEVGELYETFRDSFTSMLLEYDEYWKSKKEDNLEGLKIQMDECNIICRVIADFISYQQREAPIDIINSLDSFKEMYDRFVMTTIRIVKEEAKQITDIYVEENHALKFVFDSMKRNMLDAEKCAERLESGALGIGVTENSLSHLRFKLQEAKVTADHIMDIVDQGIPCC